MSWMWLLLLVPWLIAVLFQWGMIIAYSLVGDDFWWDRFFKQMALAVLWPWRNRV